jgi:hypothetical protein
LLAWNNILVRALKTDMKEGPEVMNETFEDS